MRANGWLIGVVICCGGAAIKLLPQSLQNMVPSICWAWQFVQRIIVFVNDQWSVVSG